MTTETMTEAHAPPPRTRSWGETAVKFANDLAAEGFPRGDLAALRRMNPDAPDAAAFWRLMARANVSANPAVERKWALVVHGIAIMTRTADADPASRSAHQRNASIGRALYHGGDPARTSAFYSPSRLNRLLTARGPILRTLLARMFRMVAAADQRFDWYQMALLVLNEGHDEQRADKIRRHIARDYFQAENQAERSRD